jgi:hypothetical protein
MILATKRVIRFCGAFWTCHSDALSRSHRPLRKDDPMNARSFYRAAFVVLSLTGSAAAETPTDAGGRFTISPADGGFLRLDKQTGAVAMCAHTGNTWACTPVEDRTTSAPSGELSRLQQENKDLKDRVKALEEALETSTPPPPPGPPGDKLQLPTDQEVDQALDYLERVYKKIRDRVKELDKPLPPPAAEPAPPPKEPL